MNTLTSSQTGHSKLRFAAPPEVGKTEQGQASPEDSYEASRTPDWEPTGWKKMGKILALGTSLTGALIGTSSARAPAQYEVAQETQIQRVLKQSSAKKAFAKFPRDFQRLAGQLSDRQTRVLKNGMRGQTKVGPLTVNHRKAFIKGTAYGKSVWGNVRQQISDAKTKYKMIDSGEERELQALITMLAKMSRGQRESLAKLMDKVRL